MPQFDSENSRPVSVETSKSEDEFDDREIKCVDCGQDFVWSAGEQTFFRDKGLQNPPKRCKTCKQAKTERIEAVIAAQNAGVKQKIEVAVNCAKCNEYTTVPFYPSQGRPVYCRSCFIQMNPDLLNKNGNGDSNGNYPPT